MIDVAILSVIRRWALREQLSIREISRRTGLSRNTIRMYLRSDVAEPSYAKRMSSSKLDPFATKLSAWLKTEATRSRKQRRTIKQMHLNLQSLGYQGSYNRVAAFARVWHKQHVLTQQTAGRGTFVPLVFGPGEAFQFDWSEDWAVLGGVRTKLQVAHLKLSHSRAFYVRAYAMRHDPAIASIVIMLRELKMHGMAQAVSELAEQGAPAFEAAQPILSQLLKAETA